ncbi:hypothetical protein IRB79_27725 (plasmid) [Cytobacillus oceanisediminis]|nr:hypothetical protein IRB79_27725 [Cytobacillus oceanisediminis]
MKQIRIRSIYNGEPSPWTYLQEHVKQENTQAPAMKTISVSVKSLKSSNQYGRFRYSEKQYGKHDGQIDSKILISKIPIRIRTQNGEFIYLQQAEIDGACPAIRIRARQEYQYGPWIYLQQEEV